MKTGAIIVGLGLGIGALLLFRAKKAAPAVPSIPSSPWGAAPKSEDVAQAQNLVELDTFYQLMNIAFATKLITFEEYRQLYTAYQDRFYQLVGGA